MMDTSQKVTTGESENAADQETAAPQAQSASTGEDYPQEVRILETAGRRFVLVGTAHVSRASVELVRHVIEKEKPDVVCVELDAQRYKALAEKTQWEKLDLKQVIRTKQLSTLLINLVLASYQKRLAGELGIEPGMELLEATRVAEDLGVPVELCDRNVRVTLRRASRETSLFRKWLLVSHLLAGMFETPKMSEEQLEQLKQKDALNELMSELGQAMPSLKKVLIDERDAYLSARIRQSVGQRVVAVVGAGHLEGIGEALADDRPVDLASLDEIPPPSPVWKWVGWGLPLLILGSIAWIGISQGRAEAIDNAVYWFLANGIPAAVGAVAALAHPLTVLAAFVAAPFTSLTPVVGAGYVTAFVQAWLQPPVVKEFQTVIEDVGVLRRWWQSKLLRVFLAFLLPGVGSMIGTWVGGVEIFSNLF